MSVRKHVGWPHAFGNAAGIAALSALAALILPPNRAAVGATLPPNRATAAIPARPSRARLPPVQGPRRAGVPLVVVDAGHGGHDPGSSGADGTREKDVALAIARAVRDALVERGRVRVALTRADDRFLVLAERREIARALDADLFLSIHCDSAPSSSARGASIYTLSQRSSDRVAASLAARENKADVLNGIDLSEETSDVSSILIDLAQRETLNDSAAFASLLGRELAPVIGLKSAFHRSAGLMVLKAPDVPSVLLETGYISNAADRALLKSPRYRRTLAEGVARAVEGFFARRLIGADDVAAAADDGDEEDAARTPRRPGRPRGRAAAPD